MTHAPYLLDSGSREAVLEALREVCVYREWILLAAHVRTNHLHSVVEADVRPERVLNDFKAYASRRLNCMGGDGRDCKRWARHGSTRWLWKDQDVEDCVCRCGAGRTHGGFHCGGFLMYGGFERFYFKAVVTLGAAWL